MQGLDSERAAQLGIEIGLGSGLGEAAGLGEGLGLCSGLALGDGLAECEGELCAAMGPFAVQPATDARAHRRTTPFFTGGCNDAWKASVTAVLTGGKWPRIPPGRFKASRGSSMKTWAVLALSLVAGLCTAPIPITAGFEVSATQSSAVGSTEQLVVKVANTGPSIPQLGLVFRSPDRWFDRHRMTELAGCTVDSRASAFACGDLAAGETRSYSFAGVAVAAGTFHYELGLRELVQPFDYVDDHPDGPDVQSWDETVSTP